VLSLLTDLREFVARHRAHGQLTADATEGAAEVSKADARAYKKSLFTAPSNRAGAKDALYYCLCVVFSFLSREPHPAATEGLT
jgi:hypothetical protein